jgi:general stress protein 26
MPTDPITQFDSRFSDPAADPTPWTEAARLLERAELYWLTTVRADGRPHVTPLVGVVHDGEAYFCTGLDEQKARNLEHNPRVALTTGNNTWAAGVDVVVEGSVDRVRGRDALQRLADAWESKYGSVWHYDVGDDVFLHEHGAEAAVFRIAAAKVMAFGKDPHGQTTFRFGD